MTSIKNNLPAHYRARAEEARTKAEAMTDDTARQALLSDADMWERMAAFEEKTFPDVGGPASGAAQSPAERSM